MTSIFDFQEVNSILNEAYKKNNAPSVTLISALKKTPYHILISTLISLRTKDQVTLEASMRLFEKADSIEELAKLSENEIAQLIYPCGFYKTKAARMIEICKILLTTNCGNIPDEIDELVKLPGVGRKTANLVVILGFNKPGICVDTHVHRISNRIGWVKTKTPEETEFALRKLLPAEYWRTINDYFVSYGQTICTPISPHCSVCKLNTVCHKNNVEKSR
ncbi:MAG: endonuclease III [Spirochaetales bacterium]|nr:endonuclease III [Spirochaetales bacterium]